MTDGLQHTAGVALRTERVDLGEVRAEMARHRKNQADLADLWGISITQVGRRLAGRVNFQEGELEALAVFLGVPLAQFLPDRASAA